MKINETLTAYNMHTGRKEGVQNFGRKTLEGEFTICVYDMVTLKLILKNRVCFVMGFLVWLL
jgi:hypothetical protein